MSGPTQPPAQSRMFTQSYPAILIDFTLIDHRMNLNNYLQRRFGSTQGLRLEELSTGLQHAQRWTITIFCGLFPNFFLTSRLIDRFLVRDVEYGRGEGRSKTAATELASERALNALQQPGTRH